MQRGGASGKGSSSAETNQTVTNNQVATESGIAVGGTNNSANISIRSLDPEVAEAAIRGNSTVSMFAIDRNADVSKFATGAVTQLSALFGDHISDLAAQNINLLQSVNQESADVAINSQNLAAHALDESFAISRSVAPQDPNYARQVLAGIDSKTIVYVILGILGILGLGYFFLKKGKS
jgi:LPXTG-motif cell wall-anchored protein